MDIQLDGKKQFTLKNNMYFIMKCSPIFFWSFMLLNLVFTLYNFHVFYFQTFLSTNFIPARILFSILLGFLVAVSFPISFHFLNLQYLNYARRNYANIAFPSDLEVHYDFSEIQIKIESSVFHLSQEVLFLTKTVHYKITNRGIYFFIDIHFFLCFIPKNQYEYFDLLQNINQMKEGL